jgi:hypothetical protein
VLTHLYIVITAGYAQFLGASAKRVHEVLRHIIDLRINQKLKRNNPVVLLRIINSSKLTEFAEKVQCVCVSKFNVCCAKLDLIMTGIQRVLSGRTVESLLSPVG